MMVGGFSAWGLWVVGCGDVVPDDHVVPDFHQTREERLQGV